MRIDAAGCEKKHAVIRVVGGWHWGLDEDDFSSDFYFFARFFKTESEHATEAHVFAKHVRPARMHHKPQALQAICSLDCKIRLS